MFESVTFAEKFSGFPFFSAPKISGLETIEKDSYGNYHFLKGTGKKKVQIIFRIQPTGVLIGNCMEEGYKATILGDEKNVVDAILYDEQNLEVGVLRSKKENQYYFDPFEDKTDCEGKIMLCKRTSICKGIKLYGGNVDEIISLNLAENLIELEDDSEKQICFTTWNSSLSGENGLVSAIRHANADYLIFVSLADAKQFPKESGPSLVLKDGNYVFPVELKKSMNQWAKEEGLWLDGFVGKTDKAMEIMDIHSFGKHLLGVYIPTQHFDTSTKEIFCSNVEKTRNILLKYIATL